MNYEIFIDLINEKTGLTFAESRVRILRDGIDSRRKTLGMTSVEDYFVLLNDSTNEMEELTTLLTINETYFFREPKHLQVFTETIIPILLRVKPTDEPINILSVGCATGEEPFSIAIKLHKKYGGAVMDRFRITAVDIDAKAIERAEKGVFRKNSFRSSHEESTDDFIWTYFKEFEPGKYKLDDFILKQIRFKQYNVLDNEGINRLFEADVIFFRNVSIYFDKETRKKALTALKKILKPWGFLILGASETNSNDIGLFELTEIDGVFVFKNSGSLEEYNGVSSVFQGLTGKVLEQVELISDSTDHDLPEEKIVDKALQREASLFFEAPLYTGTNKDSPDEEEISETELYEKAHFFFSVKRYNKALEAVDILIKKESDSIRGYILKAAILINTGKLDSAKEACERALEIDMWNFNATLYLGIAARHKDDETEALRHFKRAIYIDPSSWIAHYYMAESYMSTGELNKALREYTLVKRLIQRRESVASKEALFLFSFSNEQIIEMCKAKINQLSNAAQAVNA